MDGDLHERTYNFIDSINLTESIHIVNNSIFDKKTYNVINDRNEFINFIFNDLNNNLNIAIISQSRRQCDDYKKLLSDNFPNKIIKIYTSMTDDCEKKKNINIEWKLANVIIYSPTIEAGCSFDHDGHFNKIYGVLAANSTSQRSYLQMLARIRKIQNSTIIILNDSLFKNNIVNHYVNMDDVKQDLQKLNIFPMKTEYVTKLDIKYKISSYDDYTINFLHNLLENENKKPYYFLSYFRELIESKGNVYKFTEKNEKEQIKYEKGNNELYNNILNSNDITTEEYEIIENKKKKNENLTTTEKIESLKYYYKYKLSLNFLNIDLIIIHFIKINI